PNQQQSQEQQIIQDQAVRITALQQQIASRDQRRRGYDQAYRSSQKGQRAKDKAWGNPKVAAIDR
ncbi:hypothetical protein MBANPS3_005752, partial [Mucor bainieri]